MNSIPVLRFLGFFLWALCAGREGLRAQASDSLPPGPAPEDARFVASVRGRIYYPVACPSWRRLLLENVRFFPSAESAEAAGYARTTDPACANAGQADARAHSDGPATPEEEGPAGGICVVERVVDGDTVRCRGGERVRLLLIDAPETAQSQPGLRARLALEALLPIGDSARVELDVQERDRYGRVLAHLHASSGLWVNYVLVREGYAVPLVYPPNVRHVEKIRAAADSARSEGRGLWTSRAFECLPVDFRARRCR